MRDYDSTHLGQRFACWRLQVIFAEIEKHISHIHFQATRRIRGGKNSIELLEQLGAQLLFFLLRLFRSGFGLERFLPFLLRPLLILLGLQLCRVLSSLRFGARLGGLSCVTLCLQSLNFRLLFCPFRRCRISLGCCFGCGRRCLFSRYFFVILALHRRRSRVSRVLNGVASRLDYPLPVSLARKKAFCLIHRSLRSTKSLWRILLSLHSLGDFNRVARFVEFQRRF